VMAALLFIEHWEERSTVVEDVFAAAREAELNRQREYDAALHIQAVMRGVRLRQFVKYLHMCAVRIQMAWRGYLGRIEYHKQLAQKVEQRQLNYFHTMATKIKKVWKGHYVRKNVYDFYAMKTYLGALEEKNKIVRARLREYEEEMRQREHLEAEVKELEKYDKYARSCHYMMSTQVKAGVFVKDNEPSVFEEQIKSVFPKNLSKKNNKWHRTVEKKVDNSTYELPPLKRVQGPFKNPSVVYMQRHKSLKPTLKVQTDFNTEDVAKEKEIQEEWCKRIIDNEFAPFSRMKYEYMPSLHNNTQFSNVDYGTKSFREKPVELLGSSQFKTVFKSIPEFDNMGEAYS